MSWLTVGQAAQRMDIAPLVVRWHDDHGLLPSERTAGNQRRFLAGRYRRREDRGTSPPIFARSTVEKMYLCYLLY